MQGVVYIYQVRVEENQILFAEQYQVNIQKDQKQNINHKYKTNIQSIILGRELIVGNRRGDIYQFQFEQDKKVTKSIILSHFDDQIQFGASYSKDFGFLFLMTQNGTLTKYHKGSLKKA